MDNLDKEKREGGFCCRVWQRLFSFFAGSPGLVSLGISAFPVSFFPAGYTGFSAVSVVGFLSTLVGIPSVPWLVFPSPGLGGFWPGLRGFCFWFFRGFPSGFPCFLGRVCPAFGPPVFSGGFVSEPKA